jgi:hypothetical protein
LRRELLKNQTSPLCGRDGYDLPSPGNKRP